MVQSPLDHRLYGYGPYMSTRVYSWMNFKIFYRTLIIFFYLLQMNYWNFANNRLKSVERVREMFWKLVRNTVAAATATSRHFATCTNGPFSTSGRRFYSGGDGQPQQKNHGVAIQMIQYALTHARSKKSGGWIIRWMDSFSLFLFYRNYQRMFVFVH